MDSEKLNEQWGAVCAQINSYPDVNVAEISAFFSRLEPQAMSDSFLMLTAGNDFIKSWVEEHYLGQIQRALLDMHGVPFAVAIAVDPQQDQRKAAEQAAPAPAPVAPVGAPPAPGTFPVSAPVPPAAAPQVIEAGVPAAADQPMAAPATFPDSGLSPLLASPAPAPAAPNAAPGHFPAPESAGSPVAGTAPREEAEDASPTSSLTFNNFVIGESNKMAYSMANEVAGRPGRSVMNPLFIYGKSGLGKTHLMRAIQNYINETQPNLRTAYVDSAEFLSKFMEASIAHDREKASFRNFKNYYEEADVLLIDDIQFLQNKKQCLDMVFQLLNSLTSEGKQVVLSADRAPKNIDVDERYSSRFAAGMTAEVQPPDIETKLAIVKRFADECSANEGLSHCAIPDDIQMYIAENSSSNIRELLSAVSNVFYRMMLTDQQSITLEEARLLLDNHFSGGISRNLSAEDIQREVERFYKVSHADLLSPKRSRAIAYPRQIALYLCRELLDLTYEDIGSKFKRDHTTVIYAVSTIEERIKKERDVQEEIEALQKIIREL